MQAVGMVVAVVVAVAVTMAVLVAWRVLDATADAVADAVAEAAAVTDPTTVFVGMLVAGGAVRVGVAVADRAVAVPVAARVAVLTGVLVAEGWQLFSNTDTLLDPAFAVAMSRPPSPL